MEAEDFRKMRYVLSEPKGVSFLRMTRPIQKVERKSNMARCILIFDLINILVFAGIGVWKTKNTFTGQTYNAIITQVVLTMFFFMLTTLFYILVVFVEPGYVPT